MEAVVGLLVMLLGVSHGLETYCDGRKDGAQCYGALGGTVVLHLMDSASEIARYVWFSESTEILIGKKNIIIANRISSRSVFTPSNGTFRINDLSRTDSGEYTLILMNSDLQPSGEWTLHLSVQAPVSSVLLVSECLQGQMRVSCSSVGGDDPQYSWTLDGRELTDDELLSGNIQSESITLRANLSGYLVCSVRNGVSDVCGFTINNCISSTGTQKSVHESSDTVCIKPTTTSITSMRGKKTDVPSSNQTQTSGRGDPCCDQSESNDTVCNKPTTTSITSTGDWSLLICGLQALGFILTVTVISIYFTCRRKKYEKAESSAVPQTTEYPQDSVVMVVM